MLETDLRKHNGEIILSHDNPQIGVKYVTLEEFLKIANLPVNLEIKEVGFEEDVLSQINGFANKVLITSCNPWVLKKIRALDGNISLGPVIGCKYKLFLPIVISLLKNINIFSITLGVALVNERRMRTFKRLGWKVYVFTNDDGKMFNDPKIYQRLNDLGVDGVFTDYPNIVSKFN